MPKTETVVMVVVGSVYAETERYAKALGLSIPDYIRYLLVQKIEERNHI